MQLERFDNELKLKRQCTIHLIGPIDYIYVPMVSVLMEGYMPVSFRSIATPIVPPLVFTLAQAQRCK
jgi:hypothetical protein